jgi:hypothetical protein
MDHAQEMQEMDSQESDQKCRPKMDSQESEISYKQSG